MLATLRSRNFALLWVGGLISLTGDWILYAALPFYVYQQTHSTLATAAMVAAGLLPNLLLGSLAGVFVDRWDRKRIMVVASLLQAVVVLLLLPVRSDTWLWLVYVVSFLQTAIGTFFGPAESALLPRLVDEQHLLPANALNALNNNVARLIGPLIGGVVLEQFGMRAIVLVDSASFLLASLLIGVTQVPRTQKAAAPHASDRAVDARATFWVEWTDGLRRVHADRVVTTVFVVLVLMTFGGIMIDPLFPPFVADIVRAGPQGFGWLLTVQAAGGIIGAVVLGNAGRRISPARLLGWGSIIGGLLVLVQFNVPMLPVTLATAFLLGLPNAAHSAATVTLLQQRVPDTHLGRVMGALGATITLTSLVSVVGLAGFLGEAFGIVPMLNVAAGTIIVADLLALRALPTTMSLSEQEEPGEQNASLVM